MPSIGEQVIAELIERYARDEISDAELERAIEGVLRNSRLNRPAEEKSPPRRRRRSPIWMALGTLAGIAACTYFLPLWVLIGASFVAFIGAIALILAIAASAFSD